MINAPRVYIKFSLLITFFFQYLIVLGIDTLSVSQMQTDIDYYFETLHTVHPNLYQKYSIQEFDSLGQWMREECKKPTSALKFEYILSMVNKFVDEHTGIQSNSVDLGITRWARFISNRMYIGEDEIKTINGIPIDEIVPKLDALVSWAYTPFKRLEKTNSNLPSFLYGYYHISSPYTITFTNIETGEDSTTILNTIGARFAHNYSYNKEFHSDPIQEHFFTEDSIAVLYYNTSWLKNNFENVLDSVTQTFFKKIEQMDIKYLFIDISQNGGGSDLAHKYITRYLKSEPYDFETTVMIQPKGYALLSPKNQWFQKRFKKVVEGDNVRKINVSGNTNGFNGKVFVIMGSETFSAASDFCESIKRSRAGVLVGEPTGQRFPYSGNIDFLQLPESKIKFICPTTFDETKPSVVNSEGFLEPDIPYKLNHPLELEDFKKIVSFKNRVK